MNLENGYFLSVYNDHFSVTSACNNERDLWKFVLHPSGENLSLRNANLTTKAVDIWHGYSIMHHDFQTDGTVLNFEDGLLKGLISIKGINSGKYLSLDSDGTVSSTDQKSNNS